MSIASDSLTFSQEQCVTSAQAASNASLSTIQTTISTLPNNHSPAPSRDHYMENGGIQASITPPDTICSIFTEPGMGNAEIMKILPCENCYFHRVCILEWFDFTHERRGTCPNDRTPLFDTITADPRGTDFELSRLEPREQLEQDHRRR